MTEQDVPGTYEADTDWGKSILVLKSDHSFNQTVILNDHTQKSVTGTWELDVFPQKLGTGAFIVFKPFLEVAHDHAGDPVDGALPSINRGFLWGVSIAADPDYGISFEK